MKRYYVIAKKWSEADRKQVEFIAGEFPEFYFAKLFKEVYDNTFHTTAYVVDQYQLLSN